MGTVGINFGSASGGTGFDVATTVTSILAATSGIETPWKTQLTNLKAQDTVLSTLGADLATLSTAVSSFTNFDGVLSQKLGSSSDTNVLTLTAASTVATAGSHTVQVTSLAATSSTYSNLVTNASDVLSGMLTLQVGTADASAAATPTAAQTINIGSTNNTLSSLAQYINNGSYGVTASVVTSSTGSRLSLVSSTSGAAGQITLGGGLMDATQGLVANPADTLSGTLSVKVGTAAAQTITVGSSNNTLATLASYLNSGSYGVTASVVTDGTGSQLSLVNSTTGSPGGLTIGGTLQDTATSSSAVPAPIGFTAGQTGADAVLSVDGLPTTSASNTVTGAIPGVTFQLLSGSPGTDVQVQITNDNASVETAAAALVTAYNAVAKDIKTQTGKDSTGAAEPLYGSPTLSQLQSQLSSMLSGATTVGSISNIQQLGFSVNADGTMAVDNSALDTALNAHFSDIVGFFENKGSFGATLNTTLNTLGTSSTTGLISLAQAENASVETSLNLSVTNEDLLIAAEKISLTTELNTANQALQSIPESLTEVNQIYSATTGYNTYSG
jgi:flagellar hook-associated protein 2